MSPVPHETAILDSSIPGTSNKNLPSKNIHQSPPTTFNQTNKQKVKMFQQHLVWKNIIGMLFLHVTSLLGIWYCITFTAKLQTMIFSFIYAAFTSVSVTGGAHRLWAHRTYKAKLPFRIFLMLGQTGSMQNDLYIWVRDHRVHHKFTDTDADPHNSRRGFFFCHVGWLLMKKHPDVTVKGKTIDMSDVETDPVVIWQRKYYYPLVSLLAFVLPILFPVYFWNETMYISICVSIMRLTVALNGTWSVNSAAHMWGYKPYDSSINPVENIYVSIIGLGEGWHNYHHVFPWDYKAAELGNYKMNLTTALLDFAAYIGQAYDLKTVSKEMVKKRALRTGDGSWNYDKKTNSENDVEEKEYVPDQHSHLWGWGDKDMKEEDKKEANITYIAKEE